MFRCSWDFSAPRPFTVCGGVFCVRVCQRLIMSPLNICFPSIHLCGRKQAKCQAHSSPNKLTLMREFWREGKIIACSSAFSQVPRLIWQLMKCVMKSGRGKEDNSSRLQCSPHPEKPSFFCVPCFFLSASPCYCFCFCPKTHISKATFNQAILPNLPTHTLSSIFTDTAFKKNSSLLFSPNIHVHWHGFSVSFLVLSWQCNKLYCEDVAPARASRCIVYTSKWLRPYYTHKTNKKKKQHIIFTRLYLQIPHSSWSRAGIREEWCSSYRNWCFEWG